MKGGTMYKQRDIVLIPFPYSDLSGAKQRPALIISNKNLSKSQDRMCCLITSTNTKDGTKNIRKKSNESFLFKIFVINSNVYVIASFLK